MTTSPKHNTVPRYFVCKGRQFNCSTGPEQLEKCAKNNVGGSHSANAAATAVAVACAVACALAVPEFPAPARLKPHQQAALSLFSSALSHINFNSVASDPAHYSSGLLS